MAGHGWAWCGPARRVIWYHGSGRQRSLHFERSFAKRAFFPQVHAGYALFEVVFWQRSAAVAAPWNEMVFLGNLVTLLMASAALVSMLGLPACCCAGQRGGKVPPRSPPPLPLHAHLPAAPTRPAAALPLPGLPLPPVGDCAAGAADTGGSHPGGLRPPAVRRLRRALAHPLQAAGVWHRRSASCICRLALHQLRDGWRSRTAASHCNVTLGMLCFIRWNRSWASWRPSSSSLWAALAWLALSTGGSAPTSECWLAGHAMHMTRLSLTSWERRQHGQPHQQSLALRAPPSMWALRLPSATMCCLGFDTKIGHCSQAASPATRLPTLPPLSLWKLDLPEGVSTFNSVYGLIMLSGSVILALVHFKAS